MSSTNRAWIGAETSDSLELSLNSDGVTVFLLGEQNAGYSNSRYSYLSQAEALKLTKDAKAFDQWLKSSEIPSKETTFRLFGASALIQIVELEFTRRGFTAGKHLILAEQKLRFLFIPKENRIRKEARIKVLVVDDSETIRKLLSKIISEDPQLECVGTVELPSQVERAIQELKPDVLTLDIHMPEMDGVTLLKKLLPKFSLPAIMISSLSKEEGTFVLDALEAGAVDYIQKPTMQELRWVAPLICEKIKHAAVAKVLRSKKVTERLLTKETEIDFNYIIGIGSSTGGTEALTQVLTRFPAEIPAVLIVQHIPAIFSKAFADRMNSICPFRVKEAEHGETVEKSSVYVAPGGKQMRVEEKLGVLRIVIEDTAPVNRHKPSVDVLFDSMVALKRKKMVAAILTGMGADGAKGMLRLKEAGVHTIAQNEATCVVYGMPKEAVKLGGVAKVLPLESIAEALVNSTLKSVRSAA